MHGHRLSNLILSQYHSKLSHSKLLKLLALPLFLHFVPVVFHVLQEIPEAIVSHFHSVGFSAWWICLAPEADDPSQPSRPFQRLVLQTSVVGNLWYFHKEDSESFAT